METLEQQAEDLLDDLGIDKSPDPYLQAVRGAFRQSILAFGHAAQAEGARLALVEAAECMNRSASPGDTLSREDVRDWLRQRAEEGR